MPTSERRKPDRREKVEKIILGPDASPKNPEYFFAGGSLSFPEACRHFVTVGATGSGKSITLNLLMQSVLGKIGLDKTKRRVLVYDSKLDLVSKLSGMLPEPQREKLIILNPLDRRFTPWDIAADITTETDAHEFSELLFPRNERESSPYFSDAARSLMAGVIKRFNATARERENDKDVRDWTLRDLLLAFASTEQLKAVLNHEVTHYLLDHFKPENDRNFAGVKSTADNTVSLYRPIAALFQNSTKTPLSLRRWVNGQDGVLVMGNHEAAREATDTLNRIMFRQLSKFIIVREGEIKNDQTWIFLDELREAGKLPGLRQLLLRGRSKGVAVAMGFQDIEGVYAAYTDHEGAEIIGAAQNAAILHINPTATQTAEWASKVFGSFRTMVPTTSETQGGGYSTTTGTHPEVVANLLPSEFSEIPMPSQESGIAVGYYASTNKIPYGWGLYHWDWLNEKGPLKIEDDKQPDFQGHEDPNTILKDWGPNDDIKVRLGIELPPPPEPGGAAISRGTVLDKVGRVAH